MIAVETIPMAPEVAKVDLTHVEAAVQLFRRCRTTRTLAIFVTPIHRGLNQGTMTAHVTAQHRNDLARDLCPRPSMVPARQANVRPRTPRDNCRSQQRRHAV